MRKAISIVFAVAAGAIGFSMLAATPTYTYKNDIQPIFVANCVSSCHPPHSWEQGYDHVVGPISVWAPAAGYKIVYPTKPDSSVIIWRLRGVTPGGVTLNRMPKFGPALPAATIQEIYDWIFEGAADSTVALVISPPSNFLVSDVPNDQGHALFLTWTASPTEQSGGVSFYRIFRSRSSVLTAPVPITNFTSIDSLNSWDAHFTILIDSVAAGVTSYTDSLVYFKNIPYSYWLQSTGPGGASKMVPAGIQTSVTDAPEAFLTVSANPNPFNASTVIGYRISSDSPVLVRIYNAAGQKVTERREGTLAAGSHSFVWNASGLSSGLYFFTVRAGSHTGAGKMLLLK
jgi:hypothetical protein